MTNEEHLELEDYLSNRLLIANSKGFNPFNNYKNDRALLNIDETLTDPLILDMELDGL